MRNGLLVVAVALLLITAVTPAQAATYTFGWVTPGNTHRVLGVDYSESCNGITPAAYREFTDRILTAPTTAGPTSSIYTLMAAKPGSCTRDTNILPGIVTAASANVGLTTQGTPGPGSLLLAGTALIAIGVAMKKRQKKA